MKKQNKSLIKSAKAFRNKLTNMLDLAYEGKRQAKDHFTVIGDIVDLIKLCDMVIEGKLKQASRFMDNLDTDEREQIPINIHDKIYRLGVEVVYE